MDAAAVAAFADDDEDDEDESLKGCAIRIMQHKIKSEEKKNYTTNVCVSYISNVGLINARDLDTDESKYEPKWSIVSSFFDL